MQHHFLNTAPHVLLVTFEGAVQQIDVVRCFAIV